MPRYWTVAEAQTALPEARQLVTELRDLLRRRASEESGQRTISQTAGRDGNERSMNGHGPSGSAAAFQHEVRRIVQRVEVMGFQVKDAEVGLIDFPYLRNDEEILLCYRLDEPEIGFWHDLDSGYAGRRPISEL